MKLRSNRISVYFAPADDADNGGAGGVIDRGDVIVPPVVSPLADAGKVKDDEPKKTGADNGDKASEDEETAEERAEREAAEALAAKNARIRIPKSRFDEAQAAAKNREQVLLQEIDRLKEAKDTNAARTEVAKMSADIEKLEDQYEELILEGKKDEARKVRRQVAEMRETLTEYKTNVKSDAARRAAIDEVTFNAALAGMESVHPALNPEHEDFDSTKTDEVAELMNAFVKSGKTRVEALKKAVKYVMIEPAKNAVTDTKDKDERAAAARKKAAEALKKQPADITNVGADHDKAGKGGEGGVDVMKLDQKAFKALDEAALAKLRGDEV